MFSLNGSRVRTSSTTGRIKTQLLNLANVVFIVAALLTTPATTLMAQPLEGEHTVQLLRYLAPHQFDGGEGRDGSLASQIGRQAIATYVWDNYDALVNDELLRHRFPLNSELTHSIAASVRYKDQSGRQFFFESVPKEGQGEGRGDVQYEENLPRYEKDWVELLLSSQEKWTSKHLMVLMAVRRVPKRKPTQPPADVAELLNAPFAFDLISTTDLIRRLHVARRADLQSAPVAAALARHYAILGTLVEHHWSCEHNIFKARALLYSHKAVKLTPEDSMILWNDVLVRCLCESEWTARPILEKLRGEKKDQPAPAWADVAEAAVNWDDKALQKLAKEPGNSLAQYLLALTREYGESQQLAIRAGVPFVAEHPDCFRVSLAISKTDELGLRRQVGVTQFNQCLISIPQQLLKMKDLPEKVRELASKAEGLTDQKEQIQLSFEIVGALRATDDNNPFSWGTLASMIENLHFALSVHLLDLDVVALGVSPTQTMEKIRPLIVIHPGKEVVGFYHGDRSQREANYRKALPGLIELRLNHTNRKYTSYYAQFKKSVRTGIYVGIDQQKNFSTRSLLNDLPKRKMPFTKEDISKDLYEMAPNCGAVQAHIVDIRWELIENDIERLLETSESPVFLEAVLKRRQMDSILKRDIEKTNGICRKLIELDQSHHAYQIAANHFYLQEDFESQQKTLLDALKVPSFGLSSTAIHMELCGSYQQSGNWELSRPHGLAAAKSYSYGGLTYGANTHLGLGEFAQAEELEKANLERYYGFRLRWYFWHHWTGYGDLKAVRAETQNFMASSQDSNYTKSAQTVAYLELEGRKKEAIEVMHAFAPVKENYYRYKLFRIIMQLEEKPTPKERQEIEKELSAIAHEVSDSPEGILADFLRQERKSKSPEKIVEFASVCSETGPESYISEIDYMIARILLLKGNKKAAKPWLQKCATTCLAEPTVQALAAATLRSMGEKVEPLRFSRYGAKERLQRDQILQVFEYVSKPSDADRIQFYEQMREQTPDSNLALLCSLDFYSRKDNVEKFKDVLTELDRRFPEQPYILCRLAKAYEVEGRWNDAIETYRKVLKFSPGCLLAHNNLAWILATSDAEIVRDSRQALKSANYVYSNTDKTHLGREILLAAALAEDKKFQDAIKLLETHSKDLSPKSTDFVEMQKQIELYSNSQPYRRTPEKISVFSIKTSR